MRSSSGAGRVCFLMGPTGAGKTDIAIDLVRRYPCDIISVDSAMVYRDMDIGTGKPSAERLREAPHRLIDIREPYQSYSAAEFRTDATREIDAIIAADRIPLLVGGTGLYFRALGRGLNELPGRNPLTREKLESEARALGWPALHERLSRLDPQAARRIHPNDPQRIQRALEVFELTGRAMSEIMQAPTSNSLQRPVVSVITAPTDRSRLHARIEARFDRMLENGLLEEVRALMGRAHMHAALASMRAVGYRQAWQYLCGDSDYETMRSKSIAATRQLARRQLTWLRAEPEAIWIDSEQPDVVQRVAHAFGL